MSEISSDAGPIVLGRISQRRKRSSSRVPVRSVLYFAPCQCHSQSRPAATPPTSRMGDPVAERYREILDTLLADSDLDSDSMREAMGAIFENKWSPVRIAAFLAALRAKGETPAEIAAAAEVMREKVVPVHVEGTMVDIVGTGGDAKRTFNVSTVSAFVAAAAGVRVAKHGNRAMSSACGSSDILAALGADISLMVPEKVAEAIGAIGIGFMFAPTHHVAMKYAAPVRQELGVRTIFNVLGPLTNPAGAKRQMTGVFREELIDVYAETLRLLGSERVLIVHGDGMDEITITGVTKAAKLREDGTIERLEICPEDFGLGRAPLSAIQVGSVEESREVATSVLEGTAGPARDIVTMNAGAAIHVAGVAGTIAEGVRAAAEAIDSGKAKRKLDEFVGFFSAGG